MPSPGEKGDTKFGLTIGDRVEIQNDPHFSGWHGHVRAFGTRIVAVDLDEPPAGHTPNGQWFSPTKLRHDPK